MKAVENFKKLAESEEPESNQFMEAVSEFTDMIAVDQKKLGIEGQDDNSLPIKEGGAIAKMMKKKRTKYPSRGELHDRHGLR